jgi:hypothetical protein
VVRGPPCSRFSFAAAHAATATFGGSGSNDALALSGANCQSRSVNPQNTGRRVHLNFEALQPRHLDAGLAPHLSKPFETIIAIESAGTAYMLGYDHPKVHMRIEHPAFMKFDALP